MTPRAARSPRLPGTSGRLCRGFEGRSLYSGNVMGHWQHAEADQSGHQDGGSRVAGVSSLENPAPVPTPCCSPSHNAPDDEHLSEPLWPRQYFPVEVGIPAVETCPSCRGAGAAGLLACPVGRRCGHAPTALRSLMRRTERPRCFLPQLEGMCGKSGAMDLACETRARRRDTSPSSMSGRRPQRSPELARGRDDVAPSLPGAGRPPASRPDPRRHRERHVDVGTARTLEEDRQLRLLDATSERHGKERIARSTSPIRTVVARIAVGGADALRTKRSKRRPGGKTSRWAPGTTRKATSRQPGAAAVRPAMRQEP